MKEMEKIIKEKQYQQTFDYIEFWKVLIVPGEIFTVNYYISSFGNIKNSKKELNTHTSSRGYATIALQTINGEKKFSIHRLVAQNFLKNPLHKNIVHHIDKDKLNNHYTNLLWVTNKEHFKIHEHDEYFNFMNINGEDVTTSKYKNSQIEELCKLMQYECDNKKLQKTTGVDINTINSIRSGLTWRHISEKYNIKKLKMIKRNITRYNESDIERVCELLEKNINPKDVSQQTNVNIDTVNKVRNGEQWRRISSKYNIKPGCIKNNPEKINIAKNMIKQGLLVDHIHQLTGINKKLIYTMKYKLKKEIK